MKNSVVHLPTHIGPAGLLEFAVECASVLLAGPQYLFSYPEGCSVSNWPSPTIKAANEGFLKTLRGRANVYAIYVRGPTQQDWIPVYVGQSKSINLRGRMSHHLIKKNETMGSMLSVIQTAVADGGEIGLAFIKVEPESLRVYVEETITNLPANKVMDFPVKK